MLGDRSSKHMILLNHHDGSLRYYDWDAEISKGLKTDSKVLPLYFTTPIQSSKSPGNVLDPSIVPHHQDHQHDPSSSVSSGLLPIHLDGVLSAATLVPTSHGLVCTAVTPLS